MKELSRVLAKDVSELTEKSVTMYGWAESVRVHSKVVFIDLRDYSGITQLVITGELLDKAKSITSESVIKVTGIVGKRPTNLINPNIISGEIEVQVTELFIESVAQQLPLPINDETVAEESRLKYRYLDLRSKRMQRNLRTRHKLNNYIRDYFTQKDFVEVETPYISKSTPEGARDYLVPSRISPGNFYALPQSPQQYKQLLMVGGLERYFQIVRCFRDEDARSDRQPEFTQLDVEMSFPDFNAILEMIEELFLGMVKEFFPEKTLTFTKIPRLKYSEVMEKYGKDSPDLRKDPTNNDELAFAFVVDFPMFEWKEQEGRFDSVHHPFTAPKDEYVDNFEKSPKDALSQQYDLVLNGCEIVGGSVRIHSSEILRRVFRFLGHSDKKIDADFGHLLNSFSFGVPPHGGFAAGLDRLYSILLNERSIRDVIAFAKAGDGRDLMMNAPCAVDDSQLKELGLKKIVP